MPTHDSYAMLFDPLDGSSNTDVNGSLGTIFALRRRSPGTATISRTRSDPALNR